MKRDLVLAASVAFSEQLELLFLLAPLSPRILWSPRGFDDNSFVSMVELRHPGYSLLFAGLMRDFLKHRVKPS